MRAMQRKANAERVRRVMAVQDSYVRVSDSKEEFVRDLLADVKHFCQRFKIDFDQELASAEQHFWCESSEVES